MAYNSYTSQPGAPQAALSSQSLPVVNFPRRPGFGSDGRKLQVTTNHFELTWAGQHLITHYSVDIEPEITAGDVTRRKYEIIDHLQTISYPQVFSPRASYDGDKNLYASAEYPIGKTENFHVLMTKKKSPPPPGSPGHFILRLTIVNTVRPQLLMDYIRNGQAPSSNEVLQILNCLNVILRQAAIHWNEGPLLDVVMTYLNKRNVRDLQNLSDAEINNLNRYLKDVRVRFSHKPGMKGRPIHKFDKRGADKIELEDDGPKITQYFLDTYNVTLRYPYACCVWVSKTAALPLEMCIIEPGQLYRKKINQGDLTREMIAFSNRKPDQRINTIVQGLGDMMYDRSDYMNNAGLRVGVQPIQCEGRQLRGTPVEYKDGKLDVTNGAWNLRGKEFVRSASVGVWVVVNLCPGAGRGSFSRQQTQELVKTMELLKVGNDVRNRYKVPKPNLYLIITNGSADLYTRVKHWGDIVMGVATQHVRLDKVTRPNMQYCANVAMKINLKLSGQNHFPMGAAIKELAKVPFMVFGADTSHPGPGEKDKPSISALAASVDRNVTVYVTTVRAQEGKVEILKDLQEMTQWAIARFQEYQKATIGKSNIVPQTVIFYRDGVSEGQFAEVYTSEVQAIRSAFEAMGLKPPKITFMVVGKRHHVRFFPKRSDADRTENAPAGFVVDTDVAHPYEWDFYLQSHAGLLGTSRPMHVSVVADENGFSADSLQNLTFALTHNFPRATRTVSIPTPVYHADLACGRAPIHFDPNADIGGGLNSLEAYQNALRQAHKNLQQSMIWM
ncbi:Piwi-domain-containing protein [Dacryopinax primogenitus]|uniref:Piwi-domain-containing protein n=1 Tax=Dacryopinax primogenitus (strain DJM 731) TaxID=1858805 RepID=M5GAC6_DACPD|nr:Piwi-domain-containing protein [Dacryopinax primogenitus]EJU00853.1 Piwi-domain-containing protein [Dacryopinax primogenitus]